MTQDLFDLGGRLAIVTGGNEEKNRAALSRLGELDGRSDAIPADVTDEMAVGALFAEVVRRSS